MKSFAIVPILIALYVQFSSAFMHAGVRAQRSHSTPKREATLSGQPWRISLSLKMPLETGGQIVERRLSMAGNFLVKDGYEPPQGRLTINDDVNVEVASQFSTNPPCLCNLPVATDVMGLVDRTTEDT